MDLISEVSTKGMPGFDMERLMSRDYILENVRAQAGLTEEELFEVVSSDMRFNTVTMGQALARAMGMEEDNEFFDGLDNIFIISNDSLIHGAGVLCSDYLKVA